MRSPPAGPAAVVGHLRWQSERCAEMGSPLYAELLSRVADDATAGGPAAAVLADHVDRPGPDAVGLRLMGAVHRVVLEGRAPELAAHYPSAATAPVPGDPAAAWPALRAVLAEHREELAAGLDRAPQTNEIGRAAALWPAVLLAAAEHPGLPLRLVELGASAGLLLRADGVHYRGGGVTWGEAGSPVRLDSAWPAPPPWWGRLPGHVDVAGRLGADLHPVDPISRDGALALQSYVWADQVDRLARLRGALVLAARVPATVVHRSAVEVLEAVELTEGQVTVVQHSVFWQYVGEDERARLEARLAALGDGATASAPLAHVSLEPRRRAPGEGHRFTVQLRTWPAGGGAVRDLGEAGGHGPPVRWTA